MNSLDGYQVVDSYWYDQVPSYWKKTKNKYVFCQDKHVVGEDWEKFTLLTMGKSGVKPRDMDGGGKFPASFETYQTVEPNQLIFCLFDLDETPRTIGMSKDYGMITSAYDVFSTTEGNDPQFWTYFYQMIDDHKGLRPFYTGLRKVVRSETFMGIEVFSPPLEEQKLISRYLDKKTEQIDRLVEKIQKKIELLKEQRIALINQYVTKGLDPNVEMKDSGIEWIGEIPVHWNLNKVGYNTYVKGRIGWKGLTSEDFIDEGPYLITGTDFNSDGTINWDNVYHVDQKRYDEDPYIQLRDHDVLITKDGTIGKIVYVGNLKGQTCLNSGIFITRATNDEYIQRYFFWVLNSNIFKAFIKFNSGGSTILHLYQNVFVKFKFTIPPIQEQNEIVNYLDKQTKFIDHLLSNEEKRIKLLREYRCSLISSAVMGKVRISEDMI